MRQPGKKWLKTFRNILHRSFKKVCITNKQLNEETLNDLWNVKVHDDRFALISKLDERCITDMFELERIVSFRANKVISANGHNWERCIVN